MSVVERLLRIRFGIVLVEENALTLKQSKRSGAIFPLSSIDMSLVSEFSIGCGCGI